METAESLRTKMERCLTVLGECGKNDDALRKLRLTPAHVLLFTSTEHVSVCSGLCSLMQVGAFMAIVTELTLHPEKVNDAVLDNEHLTGCARNNLALMLYVNYRTLLEKQEEKAKPETVVEFRRKR